MAFFNSAVDILQTLVVALGDGAGIIGNENHGANLSESEQVTTIQIAELLWHPFKEINMLERWLKR